MEKISAYKEKFHAELSKFQDQEKVHALPDVFHYWSGKYLLTKLQALGFDSLLTFLCATFPTAATAVRQIQAGS
jgi:hypothetical protein